MSDIAAPPKQTVPQRVAAPLPLNPPPPSRVSPPARLPQSSSQLDPLAPRKRRVSFKNRKFLIGSILLHVGFLVIALFLIVQTTTKKEIAFKAVATPPSKKVVELQHNVQVAQRKDISSAPMQARRITTAGVAKVSLPDIPAMPDDTSPILDNIQGMGITGQGAAAGMAALSGAAGFVSKTTTPFGGAVKGSGLEGRLYDLKQPKIPKTFASEQEANEEYDRILAEFNAQNWSESVLQQYYCAPNKLYASQFLFPSMWAAEAPKAFRVEKEVQPKRWVILYRGRIVAPKSGYFRFYGGGDDILAVRIDGKVVFENDLHAFTAFRSKLVYKTLNPQKGFAVAFPGIAQGDPFRAVNAKAYDIEILIGERPGGGFNAQLMIGQDRERYKTNEQGDPLLPVFRVDDVASPKSEYNAMHAAGGPIWKIATPAPTPSILGFH